jgi:hypothetical protein
MYGPDLPWDELVNGILAMVPGLLRTAADQKLFVTRKTSATPPALAGRSRPREETDADGNPPKRHHADPDAVAETRGGSRPPARGKPFSRGGAGGRRPGARLPPKGPARACSNCKKEHPYGACTEPCKYGSSCFKGPDCPFVKGPGHSTVAKQPPGNGWKGGPRGSAGLGPKAK